MAMSKEDLVKLVDFFAKKQEDILKKNISFLSPVEQIEIEFDEAYRAKFEIELFKHIKILIEESATAAEAIGKTLSLLVDAKKAAVELAEFEDSTVAELMMGYIEIAIGNLAGAIPSLQDAPK